jgi:hypothetical protein
MDAFYVLSGSVYHNGDLSRKKSFAKKIPKMTVKTITGILKIM